MTALPPAGTAPAALHAENPFGAGLQLDDLLADMAFLDDWEDRYRYLIDLGRQLPELPAALRNDAHLVRGCQSQVWLHWRRNSDGSMDFLVDSDAHIVRGLAALVLAACNRQPAAQVAAMDINTLFADLDLVSHLSPTRGNGLRAMVEHLRAAANA